MGDISLTISLITLSVNALNTVIKRDCQIGYKSKTQLSAVSKKHNFIVQIQTGGK